MARSGETAFPLVWCSPSGQRLGVEALGAEAADPAPLPEPVPLLTPDMLCPVYSPRTLALVGAVALAVGLLVGHGLASGEKSGQTASETKGEQGSGEKSFSPPETKKTQPPAAPSPKGTVLKALLKIVNAGKGVPAKVARTVSVSGGA